VEQPTWLFPAATCRRDPDSRITGLNGPAANRALAGKYTGRVDSALARAISGAFAD